MTIEEWFISSNKKHMITRWNSDLNKGFANEIKFNRKQKYWLNCDRGLHEPELKCLTSINDGENSILICNKCNSIAQWGIDNLGEDFLEKYWHLSNDCDPWYVSHGSSRKIFIQCQNVEYHAYIIRCHSFVRGISCGFCKGRQLHEFDSFGSMCSDKLIYWSDKNTISPLKVAPNGLSYAWWKCPDGNHEDFYRMVNTSVSCHFRCPECVRERDESLLQEKVSVYLNNTYTVLHENKCNIVPINPNTNYKLPFDNEAVELKLIIEVHGQQHYKLTGFHNLSAKQNDTTPQQELEYQQWKDEYKKQYALKQGYFYLVIPFYADDKNETWKKLIDDKIEEIKQIKEAI